MGDARAGYPQPVQRGPLLATRMACLLTLLAEVKWVHRRWPWCAV